MLHLVFSRPGPVSQRLAEAWLPTTTWLRLASWLTREVPPDTWAATGYLYLARALGNEARGDIESALASEVTARRQAAIKALPFVPCLRPVLLEILRGKNASDRDAAVKSIAGRYEPDWADIAGEWLAQAKPTALTALQVVFILTLHQHPEADELATLRLAELHACLNGLAEGAKPEEVARAMLLLHTLAASANGRLALRQLLIANPAWMKVGCPVPAKWRKVGELPTLGALWSRLLGWQG
jgi:hypothetical protein